MRRSSKSCLIVAALVTTSLGASIEESKTEYKVYKTKDGSRVVIATGGKVKGGGRESAVHVYSAQNENLCSMDFSSRDGQHGFGAIKAAWTPDEQYFVFSLASSGGHQPWHAPTVFFSLRDKEIHSLDSYSAAGISKSEFALKSPNIVLTEVWRAERQESVPAEFRLDSLMEGKHRSHRPLLCAEWKVYQVDPSDLRSHD